MGLGFAIVFLLILSTIATTVCFVVAKIFLPLRASLILAPLLVASGGVGCIAGLILQIPFTPEELTTNGQVLRYLGKTLGVGVCSAGIALWLFLRWRAQRMARTAATDPAVFD